ACRLFSKPSTPRCDLIHCSVGHVEYIGPTRHGRHLRPVLRWCIYRGRDLSEGATVRRASRTAKWSSPENTRWTVLPSALIHLAGKLADSPGPTAHLSVKYTVVHGPHGSGAS